MRREIELDLHATDDIDFVHVVRHVVMGVLRASAPPEAYIVKVDRWFGPNWAGFSHQAMGAFGVSYFAELRVPPFVPNRIVSQRYFVRDGVREGYECTTGGMVLHVRQAGEANRARKVSRLCPRAALFWWSGATRETGRGALMAYVPVPDGHTSWYAELTRASRWRAGQVRCITAAELESYRSAGA